MSLKSIFQESSAWTWHIMAHSAHLGEMIREDAITSVNLATINGRAAAEGLALSITSFQGAHLEQEFGCDWMWSLGNFGYMVQAKRLDVVPRGTDCMYTIDLPQMDTLIGASQALSSQQGIDRKPAYVFYNTGLPDMRPEEAGCLVVNAMTLQRALAQRIRPGQRTVSLAPRELVALEAQPWYVMFTH